VDLDDLQQPHVNLSESVDARFQALVLGRQPVGRRGGGDEERQAEQMVIEDGGHDQLKIQDLRHSTPTL